MPDYRVTPRRSAARFAKMLGAAIAATGSLATIVAVGLLALIFGSCAPAARGTAQTTPAPAADAARAAPVDVFGIVRAEQTRSLVIEFPARIVEVIARAGAVVTPDQALLVIDAREALNDLAGLDAQIRVAELRLEQRRQEIERANLSLYQELRSLEHEIAQRETERNLARSELLSLRTSLAEGTDLDLRAIETEIRRLEIERDLALRNLETDRGLLAQGAISPAEVEHRERQLADLVGRLATAELQLARTRQAKESRVEELEFTAAQLTATIDRLRVRLSTLAPTDFIEARVQEAQIEQLRLQHERAATRLTRDYLVGEEGILEVRSPYGPAVVSEISGAPGDLIPAGTRVARIERTGRLSVEAFVPEEFIRDVAYGASVDIVALADRSRSYRGIVQHVSGAAEQRGNETVFRIHVSIDDADDFLRPNMNVDMSIRGS